MPQQTAPELSRRVAIERIGRQGLEFDVVAQAAELPALARRLAVPAVARLSCRFTLGAVHGGVIDASGLLSAETTRICVASLEPFQSVTEERFALRFVPEEALSDDDDVDAVDEIGYRGAQIDLGEAAVEQLALALDPYPRRPEAVLDGVVQVDSAPAAAEDEAAEAVTAGEGEGEGEERPNPFAVLAARRDRLQ